MISSFFSKTKPVNYVVLYGLVFLSYVLFIIFESGVALLLKNSVMHLGVLLGLLGSIYLIGVTSSTNKLTGANSFAMFFFVSLLIVYPEVFTSPELICCNLLLIFSAHSVLTLKYDKKIKEKVFEASLCVFLASFFYDWAVLFILPVYIAIASFQARRSKVWLMPLAAITAVALVSLSILLSINHTQFFVEHFQFRIHLEVFSAPDYAFLVYAIVSITVIAVVFWRLGYRRLGRNLSLRIVLMYLILPLLLVLFSKSAMRHVILLSFFATAIFLANLVETTRKDRIKELLLTLGILLPLVTFVFRQIQ